MNDSPFDTEFRVGKVVRVERFEDARKPKMAKLWIRFGEDEAAKSAAQVLYHHTPEELKGKQVLCATDLGEVEIAGFTSEVLTVGVKGFNGKPVLVTPEEEVPDGGRLY